MLLEFETAAGEVLELTTEPLRLRALEGTGVADPRQEVVTTPLRDGETLVRTTLAPRYVRASLTVAASDWAALHDKRRELASRLNPRLAAGTLRYQPVPGGTVYEIGAKYESGAGFALAGQQGFNDRMTISFRCPDPAWRVSPASSAAATLAASGWVIPWTVPWDIFESAAPIAVDNQGDLDSYPVLTFVAGGGGASDPVFTNTTTGKVMAFTGGAGLDLAAGETLVVDMDARTAFVGATNVLGLRSDASEAWPLVPGPNDIEFAVGSGGGELTVTFQRLLVGV